MRHPDSFQGTRDLDNAFDPRFTRQSGHMRILKPSLVEAQLPHAAMVGVVILVT